MVLIQDAGTQDPVSSLDEICQHCTREQRTHIKNTEGKVKYQTKCPDAYVAVSLNIMVSSKELVLWNKGSARECLKSIFTSTYVSKRWKESLCEARH
jgi:hypothetical protein